MLRPIMNWIRNFRIDLDFQTYERERLTAHKHMAEIRFSTVELDEKLKEYKRSINSDADKMFGSEINNKTEKLLDLEADIFVPEQQLLLLTRDYKLELETLYTKKSDLVFQQSSIKNEIRRLNDELGEMYKSKDDAHAELKEYKEAVDSWYAKSQRTQWLGGNKGEKIPKHSMFGQSHGDLDGYQWKRDKAYEATQKIRANIQSIKELLRLHKSELSTIYERLNFLYEDINSVKKCRDMMYVLKKQGCSKANLKEKINKLSGLIDEAQIELDKVRKYHTEHISANDKNFLVADVEEKIRRLKQGKGVFLRTFHLPENSIVRKKLHRAEWLRQRGLPADPEIK